ncbi:MAG: DUF2975 domain-containing protein [Lachnospiraceae bacterium]|nr:DUF2975 domain-containing protein [Lachnospiraceae bacterium]
MKQKMTDQNAMNQKSVDPKSVNPKAMNHRTLALCLKAIIWGMAVCGCLIHFGVIPILGADLARQHPELSRCYWPWVIFLWITVIPCYAVLIWGWRIAVSVGRDRYFTAENAQLLKRIMAAAIGDTVFFILGNLVLYGWNMSHPGILILAVFISFAGACVAVVAGSLFCLVAKAAKLREENESFI